MGHQQDLFRRAETFAELHKQDGIFVIPNPWDAGSAMILEAMGFKALATTSAGLAYGLGVPDGHSSISRQVALQNAQMIQQASTLPVSADLENGYGDSPGEVQLTIQMAAVTGLAGCSIED